MKRIVSVVTAAVVGAAIGWMLATRVGTEAGRGQSHPTVQGLMQGAVGALDAAAATLAQIEKPQGSVDSSGRWRLPIVVGREVPWEKVFPWYLPALPTDPPQLVDCLQGPGVGSTLCSAVRSTASGVVVPRSGSWIFDTSYGEVKVLVLDQGSPPADTAVAIATFVSSNVVHSAADAGYFNPWRIEEIPALHVPRLFWTGQPVKDRCGGVAALAGCVFENQGFATRKIEIGSPEDGHIVAEVEVGADRWIMVDVDWGFVFEDGRGGLLDVERLRGRLAASEEVVAVDIGGGKTWLHPELNVDGGPPFHWSRACDGAKRDPDWLLEWLRVNLPTVRVSRFDTRLASERAHDRSEALERAIVSMGDGR